MEDKTSYYRISYYPDCINYQGLVPGLSKFIVENWDADNPILNHISVEGYPFRKSMFTIVKANSSREAINIFWELYDEYMERVGEQK